MKISKSFTLFTCSSFISVATFAADEPAKPSVPAAKSASAEIAEIIDKLDYPELQVVPRASQRLKMEAANEETNWFWSHWTYEISGLATLYNGYAAGTQQRSDLAGTQSQDGKTIATMTQVVGLTWFAVGIILGSQRPYRTGMQNINRFNNEKGERAVLMRERLSEETLERAASMVRPLPGLASFSQFTLNVASAYYMSDQGRITAAVCALMSFLPLMFDDHAVEVYDKHLEYKKKIYGPLSSTSFGLDPKTRSLYPVQYLTWNF